MTIIRAEKPAFNLRSKLSELDFGTLPLDKIPKGSIVNVTQATSSTQLLTTTSQDYIDFMTGYAIVQQTGSKFLVILDAQGYYSNSSNGANIAIKRGIDNAYITLNNLYILSICIFINSRLISKNCSLFNLSKQS